MHPTQWTAEGAARSEPAVSVRRVLERSLSIMTATTEDDLLERTLAAAAVVTDAEVSAAITPTPTPNGATNPSRAPSTNEAACPNGPKRPNWSNRPNCASTAMSPTTAPRQASGRSSHRIAVWGDADLAARLAAAAIERTRSEGIRTGGPTTAFAEIDLPSAVATSLDRTLIVVASSVPGWFGPDTRSLLALVVAMAHAGLDRLRELACLVRRADSDPLTGLRHHRPFEERLRLSRPGQTAVLTADVDHFKSINDSLGHRAGDLALVSLAGALQSTLSNSDDLYRIGGDEFAAVINVADRSEVAAVAERLLAAARVAGYPISIGAAVRLPGETGRDTLHRADRALYQAKHAGRDTARLAA